MSTLGLITAFALWACQARQATTCPGRICPANDGVDLIQLGTPRALRAFEGEGPEVEKAMALSTLALTSGTAPYVVFEDFENGTWPFPYVSFSSPERIDQGTVQTAGGGAEGTNRYLTKLPLNETGTLDWARWPSPYTSRVGTTLQVWLTSPLVEL